MNYRMVLFSYSPPGTGYFPNDIAFRVIFFLNYVSRRPYRCFLCRMTPRTFTHAHYTILWSLQQTFPEIVIYRQKTIIWFRRRFHSKRHHFRCLKYGTWARQHLNICKIVYNHYLMLYLTNLILYMLYLYSIWQCKRLFSISIKPFWIDWIKSAQCFFSCSHFIYSFICLFFATTHLHHYSNSCSISFVNDIL